MASGYAHGGLRGVVPPGRQRTVVARALARGGFLRQMDWALVIATAGLTGMGTVLVWSATAPALAAAGENPHTYLKKQIIWAVVGFVLLFGVSAVDHRRFRDFAPVIYALAMLLLLAVMTPLGTSVNGAKAWISLPGGFQIEPSEFAKVALVLMSALVLAPRRSGLTLPGMRDVGLATLAAAPLIALVAGEPALGVTLVLVVVFAVMVVVSGIRLYWVAGLAAGAAAFVWLLSASHLLKSYQIARLTSFLHPGRDLAGTGYNAMEAKIAVGSGGMFGQGLFHGTFVGGNFVPSQQTDFIFTVAGEELGFVGCGVIICLLGILIFRAIRIASTADDQFGLLVASGIAVWFAFQSFVNIGMTIGLMPITGLPLPFVSYGGSAIFADMIAVGLLESVHRHRNIFA
jgi:rod shape determining protein RodA